MRFPEFSGEWGKTKFENIVSLQRGSSPRPIIEYITKSEDGVNWVKIGDMPASGRIVTRTEEKITREGAKKSRHVKIGDLILSNSMSFGQPYIMGIEGYIHDGWFVLRNYEKSLVRDYLCNLLISPSIQQQYKRLAAGGVVQNISSELVNSVIVSVPTKTEQKKIAEFISYIDDRIATQIKIIEKLESLIRGLITDVNSGRIAQCKTVYLRDLLTEQHEKNTNNYEVCSVSVSQGVINQIDYLGRSFAAKEVLHYNVVNCGDIVYTKSPTGEFPYGIVKRSDITKPVAVSPLYGVYRPINDYVGRYLHLYFKSPINAKNYLHKLIQKGAKNTINITNQHFLDNKILIPEKGWLDKIVKFAAAIEMKIATENKVLQTLQQQKDFLLSKMFI